MTDKLREAAQQALTTIEAAIITLEAANEQGKITDTIWINRFETLFDFLGSEADALRAALAEDDVKQEIETALAPDTQPRRIALDLEELHLKAKKRAKKEAALSWPEGNNRKRMQEELTDRYFYEYTGGQK